MCFFHVTAVPRRVAWHVLRLLLLVVAAATTKQLVKETKLGVDGTHEGKEEEGNELGELHGRQWLKNVENDSIDKQEEKVGAEDVVAAVPSYQPPVLQLGNFIGREPAAYRYRKMTNHARRHFPFKPTRSENTLQPFDAGKHTAQCVSHSCSSL